MSKKVKEMYIQTLADRLSGVRDCLVVSLSGLEVEQDGELRADLVSKAISVLVVNNRLASLALARAGLEPVASLLEGPSAVAWGRESIVELAKAMQRWADELEPVLIRGGYAEGSALSAEDVKTLSRLPSRAQLLGRVAAQLTASAGRVAALAAAPAAQLAGQIREIGGGQEDELQEAAA